MVETTAWCSAYLIVVALPAVVGERDLRPAPTNWSLSSLPVPLRFGLGGQYMGVKYTMRVIRETYHAWKNLVLKYEEAGLHRQLSVPSFEMLDVHSDHVAAGSFLMSPMTGATEVSEVKEQITLEPSASVDEGAPEF